MPSTQEHSLTVALDKGLQLAFPPVMVQLLQALLEPEPSFSAIAGYLQMDPMLSGKVLHIVNTANYGFAEKITNLERAAIAIGTSELFKLVISLSLQKRLNPTTKRDPEHIFGDWRLTLWSALAAEALADSFCPGGGKQAYLAGMLKDLSLYLAFCRDEAPAFLQGKGLTTLPSPGQFADEMSFWGNTHPDLAHAIFLYWGLPVDMAEAVRCHHDFAGVNGHPPLSRCLIYATRWAELLHAPDSDPGQLVSFELSLAAELGLDVSGMDNFRASCADKFNILLSQLGINRGKPESRLYDQSLSSIQSYYFLALQAVSDISLSHLQPLADNLLEQMRLFWNVDTWDLFIIPPGESLGILFSCTEGAVRQGEAYSPGEAPRKTGWATLPINGGKRKYGFLSMPVPPGGMEQSSLPMFVHMLGMCLDEHRKQSPGLLAGHDIRSLPFIMARLDSGGLVQDASSAFLETFGLSEMPAGASARTLLEEQLGISSLRFDATVGEQDDPQGGLVFAPEGHFPATPVYLNRSPVPESDGESYLLLGDVTRLNPMQALMLMHPDLLDTLFECIQEQICLLDKTGVIIFCDPSSRSMLGKNIFALSNPGVLPKDLWRASFLSTVTEVTQVQASVIVGGVLEPHELTFAPLAGSFRKQYLLTLRAGNGVPKGAKSTQSARQRDTLTGLYGYSQFHMLLNQTAELAAKHRAATGILFCDIASLHRINDEQGYQKGDAILRRVGQALAAACRPGRDYPCRYGSDKFALIVTGATQMLMESVAGTIHEQVHKLCQGEVSMHIGLTVITEAQDPRASLDLARNACRHAADMGEPTCWS